MLRTLCLFSWLFRRTLATVHFLRDMTILLAIEGYNLSIHAWVYHSKKQGSAHIFIGPKESTLSSNQLTLNAKQNYNKSYHFAAEAGRPSILNKIIRLTLLEGLLKISRSRLLLIFRRKQRDGFCFEKQEHFSSDWSLIFQQQYNFEFKFGSSFLRKKHRDHILPTTTTNSNNNNERFSLSP